MNLLGKSGVALAAGLASEFPVSSPGVQVAVCPPFPALEAVGAVLRDTGIHLGAQNLHWEPQGAFTGEVSAAMLKDVGCRYVLVGHSERRVLYGEDDVLVAHTVDSAPLPLEHGGPARLITPQHYAWKGAKWISRIELMTANRPGFWEQRGYSSSALPWRNDRYG